MEEGEERIICMEIICMKKTFFLPPRAEVDKSLKIRIIANYSKNLEED